MFDETAENIKAYNAGFLEGARLKEEDFTLAMRVMSAKIEELEDKHWEECRQIALYDDELKQLKKEMTEKYVKREEMWEKTCGYKE